MIAFDLTGWNTEGLGVTALDMADWLKGDQLGAPASAQGAETGAPSAGEKHIAPASAAAGWAVKPLDEISMMSDLTARDAWYGHAGPNANLAQDGSGAGVQFIAATAAAQAQAPLDAEPSMAAPPANDGLAVTAQFGDAITVDEASLAASLGVEPFGALAWGDPFDSAFIYEPPASPEPVRSMASSAERESEVDLLLESMALDEIPDGGLDFYGHTENDGFFDVAVIDPYSPEDAYG